MRGWLVWIVVLLAACPALASAQLSKRFRQHEYDRWAIRSSDGHWAFRSDPVVSGDDDSSSCRLVHDAQDAWSGTRPFRFMQAVVTNGGVVFGWAYHRRDDANPHGRLHVIVLANDGHTLHEDMTRLRDSRFCDGPAEPIADGVLAAEEADCVLLCMHAESEDPKERDRSESWWRYRISTGEPLGHLAPRLRVPQAEDFSTTWGVVHVPGTPLLLAHWARASFDPEASGQRYVLSDVDGNPVWTVDLPGPFAFGERRIDGRAHKHDWDGTGGILSVANRRFELDLCAESKRVAYEVTQAADGTWSAREIGRKPLFPEAEANRAAPATPEPPKRLEPVGQIDLVADDPPPPAVHGVGPFQIDDEDRFVFARRIPLSRAFELVRVKPTGELASLVRLEPHRTDVGDWTGQMCWIHDDRAIVVWHTRPAGEETYELFEVSLSDASTRALGVSIPEHCHDIERTPDGGFVVLGGSQVLVFDASCKEVWKRTAEHKVCGGGILTIDPSGRIVIQDQFGKDLHVQFLSAKGKVGAYEPIEDIGTDQPGYGAPLSPDPDGFWLLPFAHGFLKIDGSNSCTGSWTIRRPDGLEISPGRARLDREKRLWISYGGGLVRLGGDGRFDLVWNESSDTVALRDIAQLHVDVAGRIHASSRKHGDVFVFDAQGKRTRVLRTEPGDFPDGFDAWYDSVLDVQRDGAVTVGDGQLGTVRFDAEGKRVGHDPGRQWVPRVLQPGTKAAWDVYGDSVRLVGADGTVLHATDTSPDDTPLQACGPGAVASDGTFAVRARTGVRTELHEVVALFARDGTLSRLLPCDADMPSCFQWDGHRLVYLRAGVLYVRDVASGVERAFAIDRGDWKPDGYSPVLTLVRDAKEAWVYDGWSTIYRYELP